MGLYQYFFNKYHFNKALKIYGSYYSSHRKSIRSALRYYKENKGYRIAIWGAGLKGKAFLKMIDPDQRFIDCVYDIDKKKFGNRMPTGHVVIDYTRRENQNIEVVILMNNVFETETASLLAEQNMKVIYINMDSVVSGKMTAKEILQQYGRE